MGSAIIALSVRQKKESFAMALSLKDQKFMFSHLEAWVKSRLPINEWEDAIGRMWVVTLNDPDWAFSIGWYAVAREAGILGY